ncbi:hypothetical protein ACFW04_013910 [Cataglyphis niger]
MPPLIELILYHRRWNATWWAEELVFGLIKTLLNLVVCGHERDISEDIWEDNGEDGLDLELKCLFGIDSYEEDAEESWNEPPNKKSKY